MHSVESIFHKWGQIWVVKLRWNEAEEVISRQWLVCLRMAAFHWNLLLLNLKPPETDRSYGIHLIRQNKLQVALELAHIHPDKPCSLTNFASIMCHCRRYHTLNMSPFESLIPIWLNILLEYCNEQVANVKLHSITALLSFMCWGIKQATEAIKLHSQFAAAAFGAS